MIGEAFVNLISLLAEKGVLTNEEVIKLLDIVIEKGKQQKAMLDKESKQ